MEGARRRQLLFCLKPSASSGTVHPPTPQNRDAEAQTLRSSSPTSPSYFWDPPRLGSAPVLPRGGPLKSRGAGRRSPRLGRSPEARRSQPPLANELKNELLARPAVGRGGSSFEPLADTPSHKSAAREREAVGERATPRKEDPDPVPKCKDSGEGTDVTVFFSSCLK